MSSDSNNHPWTNEDTAQLLRSMIRTLLLHRSELYSDPKLHRVSNNGGNRINAKLQQLLKQLSKLHTDSNLVTEEVEKLGRVKRGGDTPKKRKSHGKLDEDDEKETRKKVKEEL